MTDASSTPDLTGGHLAVEDLEQGYGSTTVIGGFTQRFTPGVTALLGPNGAGKTTLLTTLATVLPPRSGRLEVAGRVVASEREARQARHHIGYLPQHFGYEPGMRVADAVAYGAWVRGVPSREWDSAVADALEHVGLTDRARSRMKRLSGGMRQRAAIAWALVGRPAVVLLDEPTVGLDPEQRLHFRRCLSGLTDTAVVLSTHLISDVDAVCDRAVVMAGGRALFSGDVEALRRLDPGDGEGHTALERTYSGLVRAAEDGTTGSAR